MAERDERQTDDSGGTIRPRYWAIRVLGGIYQVLGGLLMFAGISCWAAGVVYLLKGGPTPDEVETLYKLGLIALNCLGGGLVSLAFGQALFCLRDLARNSFYWRRG